MDRARARRGISGAVGVARVGAWSRNLGFAREPVQAVAGAGELPSSGLVFSLSVKRQEFKHGEAYQISQVPARAKLPH